MTIEELIAELDEYSDHIEVVIEVIEDRSIKSFVLREGGILDGLKINQVGLPTEACPKINWVIEWLEKKDPSDSIINFTVNNKQVGYIADSITCEYSYATIHLEKP